MTQLLIMPDQQAAYARNEQAYVADTELKGGTVHPDNATKFLWTMIPNRNDERVGLVMNDGDDPSLTTAEEKTAFITPEEAKAAGFVWIE
jgi:hypothetical protein